MDIINSDSPKNQLPLNQVLIGHCLEVLKGLPSNSVHCCVTSPPYWGLRDYGLPPVHWPAVSYSPMPGLPQITIPEQEANLGLEPDLWAFVGHMVSIFREVYRILRDDGTLWLNLGDTYITSPPGNNGKFNEETLGDGAYKRRQVRQLGHGEDMQAIYQKPKELKMKDLAGIPWRVAYALQADGWYLRSDVIWHKPNPMPESIQDRPTKAHEYIFLMSKSDRYFYDIEATREEASDNPISMARRSRQDFGAVGTKALRGTGQGQSGKGENAQYKGSHRNRRSVWSVATQSYPGSHFATFPTKLIEPMILASTSEYGICGKCGAQWARVLEKESQKHPPQPQDHLPTDGRRENGTRGNRLANVGQYTGDSVTTGWQPTCQCNAEVVPAIVLDPFFGSGTTGEVAIKYRRKFIGIDANPTYATELAPERLNGTQIKLMEAA